MKTNYSILILEEVRNFLSAIPALDQGKISAVITSMESGSFESIHIKTLQSPIKELIVKKYRLIFFIHHSVIYFIVVFIKKSAKTPKKEIKNAEKIYKIIIENN